MMSVCMHMCRCTLDTNLRIWKNYISQKILFLQSNVIKTESRAEKTVIITPSLVI